MQRARSALQRYWSPAVAILVVDAVLSELRQNPRAEMLVRYADGVGHLLALLSGVTFDELQRRLVGLVVQLWRRRRSR